MQYKTFTEMPVWIDAMDLANEIFQITDSLPRKEDYGLTSQIRRASVSISTNIAEGFGRAGSKEKIQFYMYSRGSAFETQSLLVYGERVKYFDPLKVNMCLSRIEMIISALNKLSKFLSSCTK